MIQLFVHWTTISEVCSLFKPACWCLVLKQMTYMPNLEKILLIIYNYVMACLGLIISMHTGPKKLGEKKEKMFTVMNITMIMKKILKMKINYNRHTSVLLGMVCSCSILEMSIITSKGPSFL